MCQALVSKREVTLFTLSQRTSYYIVTKNVDFELLQKISPMVRNAQCLKKEILKTKILMKRGGEARKVVSIHGQKKNNRCVVLFYPG